MADEEQDEGNFSSAEVAALWEETKAALRGSDDEAARAFGTAFTFPPPTSNDLREVIQALGVSTQDPDFFLSQSLSLEGFRHVDFYSADLPHQAYEWGRQFLVQALKETRTVICVDSAPYKALRKEYKNTPKALAVAISSSVLQYMGISEPMLLGVATLVVMTIASVGHATFCKMTEEEVLKAIDTKVSRKQG